MRCCLAAKDHCRHMDQAYVVVEEFSAYSTYFLFLLGSYLVIFKIMKIFSVPQAPMLSYYKNDYDTESSDGSSSCSDKEKGQIDELIRRCKVLTEA